MRLFRFGESGQEKPGLIWNNQRVDISTVVDDYNEAFFASDGLKRLQHDLDTTSLAGTELPIVPSDTRLGPPLARPSKIICVGLNYADHARETGVPIPTEPVIFLKATSAYSGPNDSIVLPKGALKTDWEVELAVVIGKRACYVTEADAMNYVAGYCLHNDLSEREFQLERGGTWDKGKGCDTFAPIGPYLVTPDEIDVNNLRLWLTVNGQIRQVGTTKQFIFRIPELITYISRFMTLLPGDILSTGTPPGVGLGMNPPQYLKAGDIVELGIDGLGTARQPVIAYQTTY